jgi:hypothetical protein
MYVSAASQTLGLVLTVLGAFKLAGPVVLPKDWSAAPRFRVAAAPTPGGGIAILQLRL